MSCVKEQYAKKEGKIFIYCVENRHNCRTTFISGRICTIWLCSNGCFVTKKRSAIIAIRLLVASHAPIDGGGTATPEVL